MGLIVISINLFIIYVVYRFLYSSESLIPVIGSLPSKQRSSALSRYVLTYTPPSPSPLCVVSVQRPHTPGPVSILTPRRRCLCVYRAAVRHGRRAARDLGTLQRSRQRCGGGSVGGWRAGPARQVDRQLQQAAQRDGLQQLPDRMTRTGQTDRPSSTRSRDDPDRTHGRTCSGSRLRDVHQR